MTADISSADLEGAPGAVADTRHFAFILWPHYSAIAFAAAVEPLRLANLLSGRALYQWTCHSLDGEPALASNGLRSLVDGPVSSLDKPDVALICGGVRVDEVPLDRKLAERLRFLVSHGRAVGAVCTGSHVLAKLGLLDGYRCTIHWENLGSLRESHPDLDASEAVYIIDRNRYTCAGGTAAIDMMLHLISMHHGGALATACADQMIYHQIRESENPQRLDLHLRLGVRHNRLLAAVELMENNLEMPLRCDELATRVHLSSRQLERLFHKYLGMTPTRYYLNLRLQQAQRLLRQTHKPILSIAIACGFVSASHFTKCYRDLFGHAPGEERRQTGPTNTGPTNTGPGSTEARRLGRKDIGGVS